MGLITTIILNLFVNYVLCDPPGPIICLTDERNFHDPGESLINKYCNQIIGEPIRINIQNWNLLTPYEDGEVPPTMMATELSRMMSLFNNSNFNNIDKIVRLELFDRAPVHPEDASRFVNSSLYKTLRAEMHRNRISGVALYIPHPLNEIRLDDVMKVAASLKQYNITKYFLLRIPRRDRLRKSIQEYYDSYIDGYLDYQTLGGVFSDIHDDVALVPDPFVTPDQAHIHKTFPHIVPKLYVNGREGNKYTGPWRYEKVMLCSFIVNNGMNWTISATRYDALVGKNETNIVTLDTMKSLELLTKYLKNRYFPGLTLKLTRADFSKMELCPLNYTDMLQVASDTWKDKNVDLIIKQEEKDIKHLFRTVLLRHVIHYKEVCQNCDKNKKLDPNCPECLARETKRESRLLDPSSGQPNSVPLSLKSSELPEIKKLSEYTDPPASPAGPIGKSLVIAEPKGDEKFTIENVETFKIKHELVYWPRDLKTVPVSRPVLAIRDPWIYRVVRDGPLFTGAETLSKLPEFVAKDNFLYLAPRHMRNSHDFESPDDPTSVLDGESPKYYIEQDRIHKIINRTPRSPKEHHLEPQFTLSGNKINRHPSVMRGTTAGVSDTYSLLKGSYFMKFGIVYEFQDTDTLNFSISTTNLKPLYILSNDVFYVLPKELQNNTLEVKNLLKYYENRKDVNLYIIKDGIAYYYNTQKINLGGVQKASWDLVMNSK